MLRDTRLELISPTTADHNLIMRMDRSVKSDELLTLIFTWADSTNGLEFPLLYFRTGYASPHI